MCVTSSSSFIIIKGMPVLLGRQRVSRLGVYTTMCHKHQRLDRSLDLMQLNPGLGCLDGEIRSGRLLAGTSGLIMALSIRLCLSAFWWMLLQDQIFTWSCLHGIILIILILESL